MAELSLAYWTLPLFFGIAILYSSVGHGGATGYLALFALFNAASTAVVPVALTMNVIVAGTGFLIYFRNGHFRPPLLLPFVLGSIPAAFIGGSIRVQSVEFNVILGVALILAGMRLLFVRNVFRSTKSVPARQLWTIGISIGIILGLVSGMIGIGGGIFLSPIILFLGWADLRETATISSAFIVLNSLSGLTAHLLRGNIVIESAAVLGAVVLAGGIVGATIGSKQARIPVLSTMLAAVLVFAGGKLIMMVVGLSM